MSAQHTPGPKSFYWFPNHGDDDGNNAYTVCYGNEEEDTISGENFIVTCEDTQDDADECCKRLNGIAAAPLLKEEVETLKTAIREALQADNQYSFFLEGYANGSASISEVRNAGEERGKAFSKLFDLTLNLNP